ncbi:MAG TPA: DUF2723 domain-containing protein [Bacteroidia bacterium]|jgi:hypothetical protein|nr:DUF2723 domain-containing protein [Bacteroidia bacterium]
MVNNYKMINTVLGWLVFAVAAFTFISCIEPTASFWDCGEYIACSYKLEVGHPPGAPTFLLLGRFFSLFASDQAHVAACVNIMSALASAGTILFMFWSITLLGKKMVTTEIFYSGGTGKVKDVKRVPVVGLGLLGSIANLVNLSRESDAHAEARGTETVRKKEMSNGQMWAIFGSAAVGSLAYCFSDSFWFSAVEGEVYGMSSFFTALVFWAILRWDAEEDSRADRWIVFIAYMMGLSIGVHLLNLLTIPSIVFIIYFKKFNHSRKNFILASLAAVGMLGIVQNGIIPGIVSAAANYELLFVNSVGLPFNYGTIIYFTLLIGMLVTGILYTSRGGKQRFQYFIYTGGAFFFFSVVGAAMYGKWVLPLITFGLAAYLIYKLRENRVVLNTIILSFTVLLIGYSSFFVLVIRSKANTPMDENNPENAISLLSYLNREQYGDWPIAYGPYYNAPIDPDNQADDGSPVYAQDAASGTYVVSDARKQSVYNFAPEMCTVFPRMWDMSQRSHATMYEELGDVKHNKTRVKVKSRYKEGEYETYDCPTFTANLTYFWNYQLEWMYWRYFMWNFAGRQNDVQGAMPNATDGNWQSGFGGDKIGDVVLPERMKDNKANNKFFLIPLLLGLFGMWYHFWKDWRNAMVVMLLFLFTGLAIVVYLNQYPQQPRERDYAYAGSFFAFAFWIGFAVYGIYDLLTKYAKAPQTAAAGLATVLCLSAPYVMGQQGWDDHNRSNRYTCRDFAENYLTSCDKDAVLFTNGDNDTFPLWYAQEVEGYRTDVRVLNLSLMNTDWYIDQANRKAYDSDRLPFSLDKSRYREGSCDQVLISDKCFDKNNKAIMGPLMNLKDVMALVRKADPSVIQLDHGQDDNGDGYNDTTFVLPTNHFYIDVNKALVKSNGTVPADTPDSLIQDKVEFQLTKRYLYKADLMILDLIANNDWKRPIYFAVTAGNDSYMNLENNFRLEGLTYRLVPMKRDKHGLFNEPLGCNTQLMYDHVMGNGKDIQGFKFGGLDNLKAKIYMDENNLRFTTNQRLQMMELAKLLNDEGKKDMAKKVLDKCMQMMPREHVPYETAMIYMIDVYYKADGFKEGNQLANDLFDQCAEEYNFYTKLASKESDNSDFTEEAGRLAQGMKMIQHYAEQAKQTAVSDALKKRLTDLKLNDDALLPDDMQQAPPQQQFNQAQMESLMKAMKIDTSDPKKAANR